jgi:ribosomal protein S18 acetylase RimI-like enzyme
MPLVLSRPALAECASICADLHTASWNIAYRGILSDAWLDNEMPANRQAHWQKAVKTTDVTRHTILASLDGQPAGFLCLMPDGQPEWGGYIDNLHVRPDAKGSGIGRRLMAECAKDWLAMGRSAPLHLGVFANNAPARAFYERMGGKLVAEWDEDFYGNPAQAVRYQWQDVHALSMACDPARVSP